jgi:hypothetical protein
MARDETARDSRLLDWRSSLRLAGAGASAVAGTGAVSAEDSSADTISVPAAGTKGVSVGDGETLQNALIDVTAGGAAHPEVRDGDE